MSTTHILAVCAVFFLGALAPVSAQLGAQSFPRIDFSDDIVTDAEIDIAETEFSDPGMLPDHPFYFLKRLGEGIQSFLTFEKEGKARLHLSFAKTRLAEAKKMIEQNKPEEARAALDAFGSELENFPLPNASASSEVLEKSIIVLGVVMEKAPEEARPALERAFNRSVEKKAGVQVKGKESSIERVKNEHERGQSIQEQVRERTRAGTPVLCIQVITPAHNKETGECREFPTPCDVPEGWKRVHECDAEQVAARPEQKKPDTVPTSPDTTAVVTEIAGDAESGKTEPPVDVKGQLQKTLK